MDTGRLVPEAALLLSQAISTADECLTLVASLKQVQERLEAAGLPLTAEPDVWAGAQQGLEQSERALQHARGCFEEMLSQLTSSRQAGGTRAWVDQYVRLNDQLQKNISRAGQHASRVYELVRPAIVEYYLQEATRNPKWTEVWPRDAETAIKVLDRLAEEVGSSSLDALDVQLARLRWEVGWSQPEIAQVAGISQPSVASRLGRVETQINLEVAVELIRAQAATEDFAVRHWKVSSATGPAAEVRLTADGTDLWLEVLVAAGESGARRGPASGRGPAFDFLRMEATRAYQSSDGGPVRGIAVYFRDSGFVGFYTLGQVGNLLRQLGRVPTELVLQRLREQEGTARTLKELLRRAETAENSPER